MPAALDLLSRGIAVIASAFGTVSVSIQGLGTVNADFNDLGRREELEVNGRRISFSAMLEFPRSAFPTATAATLSGLEGKLVTRQDTGAVYRVSGEVSLDELTVRFPLDSRNK